MVHSQFAYGIRPLRIFLLCVLLFPIVFLQRPPDFTRRIRSFFSEVTPFSPPQPQPPPRHNSLLLRCDTDTNPDSPTYVFGGHSYSFGDTSQGFLRDLWRVSFSSSILPTEEVQVTSNWTHFSFDGKFETGVDLEGADFKTIFKDSNRIGSRRGSVGVFDCQTNPQNLIIVGGFGFGGGGSLGYLKDIWIIRLSDGFSRVLFEGPYKDVDKQGSYTSGSCGNWVDNEDISMSGREGMTVSLVKDQTVGSDMLNDRILMVVGGYGIDPSTKDSGPFFLHDVFGIRVRDMRVKYFGTEVPTFDMLPAVGLQGGFSTLNRAGSRAWTASWNGVSDGVDVMYVYGGQGPSGSLRDVWALRVDDVDLPLWKFVGGSLVPMSLSSVDNGIVVEEDSLSVTNRAPAGWGFSSLVLTQDDVQYGLVFAGMRSNAFRSDEVWVFGPNGNSTRRLWTSLVGMNSPEKADGSDPSLWTPGAVAFASVLYVESNPSYGGPLFVIWGGERPDGTVSESEFVLMLEMNRCGGISSDLDASCGENGTCVSEGQCDCDHGYSGDVCEWYTCNGILWNESAAVCSGNGSCSELDLCECNSGYLGSWCESWNCGGISKDLPEACSSNGLCVAPEACSCDEGYFLSDCSEWMCGSYNSSDPMVCSEAGDCVSPATCVCWPGSRSFGLLCDEFVGMVSILEVSDEGIPSALYVPYVTPVHNDGVVLGQFFDCSPLVILPEESDSSLRCVWRTEGTLTSFLKIILPSDQAFGLEHGTTIYVLPSMGLPDEALVDLSVIVNGTQLEETDPGPADPEENDPVMEISIIIVSTLVGVVGSILILLCLCCCVQSCRSEASAKRESRMSLTRAVLGNGDPSSLQEASFSIDESMFRIRQEDVRLLKIIGSGGSGATVFRGEWCGQEVAVKVFRLTTYSDNHVDFELFEKEISILASVSHPNIVSFFGVCLSPPRLCFVCEFCSNGDLREFFARLPKETPFSMEESLRLLLGVLGALDYLHNRDVIHRDIKADNVLLDKNRVAKLTDFGTCKKILKIDSSKQMNTLRIGTAQYMAPEVVIGSSYGFAVDIFSFSILSYEVLTRNFDPYGTLSALTVDFESNSAVEFKVATDPNHRPQFPDQEAFVTQYGVKIFELIHRGWSSDAGSRPSLCEFYEEFCRALSDDDNAGGDRENSPDFDALLCSIPIPEIVCELESEETSPVQQKVTTTVKGESEDSTSTLNPSLNLGSEGTPPVQQKTVTTGKGESEDSSKSGLNPKLNLVSEGDETRNGDDEKREVPDEPEIRDDVTRIEEDVNQGQCEEEVKCDDFK